MVRDWVRLVYLKYGLQGAYWRTWDEGHRNKVLLAGMVLDHFKNTVIQGEVIGGFGLAPSAMCHRS